jgi:hypothetical protein
MIDNGAWNVLDLEKLRAGDHEFDDIVPQHINDDLAGRFNLGAARDSLVELGKRGEVLGVGAVAQPACGDLKKWALDEYIVRVVTIWGMREVCWGAMKWSEIWGCDEKGRVDLTGIDWDGIVSEYDRERREGRDPGKHWGD